jgi:hypothetical protein
VSSATIPPQNRFSLFIHPYVYCFESLDLMNNRIRLTASLLIVDEPTRLVIGQLFSLPFAVVTTLLSYLPQNIGLNGFSEPTIKMLLEF